VKQKNSSGPVVAVPIFLVMAVSRFFRALSPRACRFHPTCSVYAAEVLRGRGFREGLWLAFGRIIRCHPFSPGGFDPPPVLREESIDG